MAWLLVWWFGIHLLLEVKPICLWVYIDCRCLNLTHFVSVIPTFCFNLVFAEVFHFVGLSTVFQFIDYSRLPFRLVCFLFDYENTIL